MTNDPQAEVDRLRARLLAGRGPGATQDEIDSQTRQRAQYRGRPVVEQLESLHERTAAARGDTAAMRRNVDRTRDRLSAGVDQIAGRLDPRRRQRPSGLLVAVLVALVLLLVGRRRRSQ